MEGEGGGEWGWRGERWRWERREVNWFHGRKGRKGEGRVSFSSPSLSFFTLSLSSFSSFDNLSSKQHSPYSREKRRGRGKERERELLNDRKKGGDIDREGEGEEEWGGVERGGGVVRKDMGIDVIPVLFSPVKKI